jgi:hypothetical protein
MANYRPVCSGRTLAILPSALICSVAFCHRRRDQVLRVYDFVWSKPLRDVAVELGISDVGLAKACKRHEVPRPEQGYWNKVHAGKPVKKAAFAEVGDPRLERIELGGMLSQLPAQARTEIEGMRMQAKVPASAPSAPPREPSTELHKSIEPTIRTLRRSKPDSAGAVRSSGTDSATSRWAPASVERVVSILSDLTRSLETRGLSMERTAAFRSRAGRIAFVQIWSLRENRCGSPVFSGRYRRRTVPC